MRSFGDLLDRRVNNFDFLRFFLASLVILQHSFPLLYGMPALAREPLARLTHGQIYSGGLAVYGFFAISGFLIAKSWETSKSANDYLRKRLLRIYPGYFVAILVSVFVVGPLGGATLHDYVAEKGSVLRHLGVNLFFLKEYRNYLPGAFKHLPIPYFPNGSLWTIRLELMCYIMLALFGLCGLLTSLWRPKPNGPRQWGIILAILIVMQATFYFYLNNHNIAIPFVGPAKDFTYLAPYFLAGMLFYLLRDRIPNSPYLMVGMIMCFILSIVFKIALLTLPFLLPYMLFYIAFMPGLKVQNFGKRGDLSYGMYLYGWPAQQILTQYFGRWLNPWTLCFSAFCLACGMAALSWHLVEKPFLKLKARQTINQMPLPEPIEVASDREPVVKKEGITID